MQCPQHYVVLVLNILHWIEQIKVSQDEKGVCV